MITDKSAELIDWLSWERGGRRFDGSIINWGKLFSLGGEGGETPSMNEHFCLVETVKNRQKVL